MPVAARAVAPPDTESAQWPRLPGWADLGVGRGRARGGRGRIGASAARAKGVEAQSKAGVKWGVAPQERKKNKDLEVKTGGVRGLLFCHSSD